jgi:hypothetical protein
MLKQTHAVLRAADSVRSSEAVETATWAAEEGTRIFDEIRNMLDRLQWKNTDSVPGATIQQRVQLSFKEHRVAYLLAQLESLKLSLSAMLQVLQLGKLMASTF